MKVRRLFLLTLCLPLIAASGCGPQHAPVSIDLLIPQAGAPPLTQASSVLAEKGATLTFKAPGSPAGTTLEVQFLRNGVAVEECKGQNSTTLTGAPPLQCTLTTTGDFDIAVTEIAPDGHRKPRSPVVKAYIRPCKGCTT